MPAKQRNDPKVRQVPSTEGLPAPKSWSEIGDESSGRDQIICPKQHMFLAYTSMLSLLGCFLDTALEAIPFWWFNPSPNGTYEWSKFDELLTIPVFHHLHQHLTTVKTQIKTEFDKPEPAFNIAGAIIAYDTGSTVNWHYKTSFITKFNWPVTGPAAGGAGAKEMICYLFFDKQDKVNVVIVEDNASMSYLEIIGILTTTAVKKLQKYEPVTKRCSCCNRIVAKHHRCGKCGVARYCDRDCQVAHWPEHKPVCKQVREEASQAGDGGLGLDKLDLGGPA